MNPTQVGDIRLADSALQPTRIGRRNSRQTKVVPNTVLLRGSHSGHEKSRQGSPSGLGLISRKTYARFRLRQPMPNIPRAVRASVEGSGTR